MVGMGDWVTAWTGGEEGGGQHMLGNSIAHRPAKMLKVPYGWNSTSEQKGVRPSLGKATTSMDPLNPYSTAGLQDTMVLREDIWSRLPPEIFERVLSFLPVPDLSRFRSVCKSWDELISKPSFHDLWGVNGKMQEFLFITHYSFHRPGTCFSCIDPALKRTLRFLDLDAKRWYSIECIEDEYDISDVQISYRDYDGLVLTMDDGFILEFIGDRRGHLVLSDPVAMTSTTLPAPPIQWGLGAVPLMVFIVDNAARTFKILVQSNSCKNLRSSETRTCVYESSTNKWRGLKDPPRELSVRTARSAVFFQGLLYVVFGTRDWHENYHRFVLLSYSLEEDMWREVSVPTIPSGQRSRPQLFVSGHRLFMMVWNMKASRGDPVFNYDNSLFEVVQICIGGNTSRKVLETSTKKLLRDFGQEYVDIQFGVPFIDPKGFCKSLVLLCHLSGKMISYDLVSGSRDVLPPYPLGLTSVLKLPDRGVAAFPPSYVGKSMKLSLRNLLSPVTLNVR